MGRILVTEPDEEPEEAKESEKVEAEPEKKNDFTPIPLTEEEQASKREHVLYYLQLYTIG